MLWCVVYVVSVAQFVSEVIPSEVDLSYERLAELRYTHMFVKEVLRMYTPVIGSVRVAKVRSREDDYSVNAIRRLHRDPLISSSVPGKHKNRQLRHSERSRISLHFSLSFSLPIALFHDRMIV